MSGKAWTDKNEYKQLSSELRALSRDAFADRALELLRIRWPECIAAPRLRVVDRKGVDLYVWNTLAVQCKGFEVSEERLGRSQARQCVDSIDKFDASDVRVEHYLLVHNRDARDEEFRAIVEERVAALERSGRVATAELWDVKRLLREVFNGMSARITSALETMSKQHLDAFGSSDVDPVTVVPVQVRQLVLDRHHLESETAPEVLLDDPARLVFASGRANLTLLLGEAGYGKTTAARRIVQQSDRPVFFIPAAKIDSRVVGSKDLLERCIDVAELLDIADVGNVERWRLVARPVLENLLKDPETRAGLLFDGLDESPFLTRERGGLQHFFNLFNAVRVPVVLTARTEFWTGRKHDLQSSFGKVGEHKGGIRKHVRQAELIDWTPEQMTELATRYRETVGDEAGRQRLGQLIELLRGNEYESFYGDIPRRPLFLRMILDTVAERDAHRVRRSELVLDWTLLKIRRDVHESQRWGTAGRPPIANETATRDTIELSLVAMTAAARIMTEVHDGRVILLPHGDARAVAAAVPALSGITDLGGLVLNSLLAPVDTKLHEPQRLRFSHLLFHEFFLARFVVTHPEAFHGLELPKETQLFVRDMQ